MTGKYDKSVVPFIADSRNERTRGYLHKLETLRCRYDTRNYSFTVRIVKVWNSLPDLVVCAELLNSFKNRLDTHWSDAEMYYDYEADII